MTYKRHWNDQKEGITHIYATGSSACRTLEIDGLFLPAGKTFTGETGQKEYAFTVLGGTCAVTGDGFDYPAVGKRKNVFDGKAYAFYIPRRKAFSITAKSDLRAMIVKCPAAADFPPHLVTPEDIVVKHLGKPGFEREAHFIIDERMQANRIYVGENFIEGGQWSGYPGHKHDVNDVPREGFAEEVYYFEFDKPTGYGIQQVYTADKAIDETYAVRTGDIVEIPQGYHPGTVVPGYTGYLLWIMSCDTRGFYRTTDPDHQWIE